MLQTTGPRWGWRHDIHKTITWRYLGIAWTRSKIVTKWHYKIKYQHSYCTCFTEAQVLYFQSNCSFSIATSRGFPAEFGCFRALPESPEKVQLATFSTFPVYNSEKNPFPEIYRKNPRRVILTMYIVHVTGKKKKSFQVRVHLSSKEVNT